MALVVHPPGRSWSMAFALSGRLEMGEMGLYFELDMVSAPVGRPSETVLRAVVLDICL